MKRLIAAIFVSAYLLGPALADARKDAEYIVSQTVNETLFSGAMQALMPVIASAIQNDLGKLGVPVTKPETLIKILFEEFMDDFVIQMQSATVDYYYTEFSASELGDIAGFYRTPTGQALLKKTPELMAFGAETGRRVGGTVGQSVAGRLADRIEKDGIELTTPENRQKLLNALRQ